ncbi:hypothetical protein M408DRAFT_329760 [Serendipita vermifera MAFF 305830]|uniref:F-box domain-containing protein n=1 Tax=Serendipita vermifera MAFF 305830 TaxID=933852 RepID=A0A0C2XF85_SERVB|nr:hypothetical protein M408DRAFT_329760 [Serendipita vermifera MAFF 305830]
MIDYSNIAVELWIQILSWVIDAPYVLDTMLDTDRDYWVNSIRYHDVEVYADSERQRKTLRLVCRSWREFADSHKYRWITYDPKGSADKREQDLALEAIAQCKNPALASATDGLKIMSRPRRLLFHIVTEDDMEVFRLCIDSTLLAKVTTLFIECPDTYEDQVFEEIISKCSKIPKVGCLAIRAPKSHSAPLQAISTAFPGLITLTINNKSLVPFHPRENDRLILPDLEILELDLSAFRPGAFEKWSLPGLIHLSTPLNRRDAQSVHILLEPVRVLGANLIFLNIYRLQAPIVIPPDFWRWCPRLVEFLAFFSWVYFDVPAPADHPLRYLVHWPHYDATEDRWIPGWVPGSSQKSLPLVLRNLQALPRGVTQFIVWKSWPEYLDMLAPRYDSEERNKILVKMHEIAVERQIHVEDQEKITLGDHLAGVEK